MKMIIFDFDGTLADTRKTIVSSKQKTMKIMGLEILDEETCASTIGLSSRAGFKKYYPGLSEEKLDECVAIYRKIFEEEIKRTPPVLFPNVEKVIKNLAKRNIIMTIASARNKASLKGFLDGMGITDYFGYILGQEDTEFLKPHPEPVIKTLDVFSVKAENTLVVGDMPVDIEMGKNAGTKTCGVTYGNSTKEELKKAGADYIINDMKELLSVCNILGIN